MRPAADLVKFLVVDDVEENLIAMEALLRREGLEVHTAQSADEALELLLAHEFALAFLDVQMPGMDGFALAETMRGAERTRSIPIIFVTGRAEEANRVFRGYDAGAVDFLVKPIDPAVIRSKAQTFFDLAHQRHELVAITEELRDTLRLNEMFLAAITHDLRNPLSAIMNGAELVSAVASDARVTEAAKRIGRSSRRMSKMLDELADLARVRLGDGLRLAFSDVDLATVAREVVAEAGSTAGERAIELELVGDLRGRWDASRLERVLSNLVSNAVSHGQREVAVRVRCFGHEADHVSIEVWNAGSIPVEQQARIFAPFCSGKEQSDKGSLGLGLYIVDQVVAAHRGRVDLVSSPSEGTTFTVVLPRLGV